jgi:hypothetical protein
MTLDGDQARGPDARKVGTERATPNVNRALASPKQAPDHAEAAGKSSTAEKAMKFHVSHSPVA